MKKLLLPLVLLTAGSFWGIRALPAHSPSAEETVARLEADPNATPLSGARDLVQAMLSTAWGQVDADRLKVLSQLNQGYIAVAEAEREGAAEKAARIRSGTDHLLEHFLRDLPLSLPVDLKGDRPVMSAAHVFEFAGDTGVMLLRLDAGPGRGGCSVMEINFEKHRETEPYPVLHYIPGTTCWVLLRALHAPAGTHHTYVNFQTDSSKGQQLGRVTTKVAESGYLKLGITEGETSSTTPVLIRFRHRENGSTYRPSNAVDLFDQMHDIAGSMSVGRGNPDVLKVPNKFRGFYWCVPGSFQMSMPPGTWDLDIYKGIEYKNISSTITITSGQAVEKAFRMQRWIDMRSRGWWSGDDHIHARLMSDDDADRLLVWANATDLSVCNILRMGNHMRTVYEQRGFGPDFRVLRGNQALVPGQEDPRFFFGHSIGLNIREPVRDLARYGLNDWVADEVHRLGGLYGHAHVAADQFKISNDMTMLMPFGKSDFGEILQADVLGTAIVCSPHARG